MHRTMMAVKMLVPPETPNEIVSRYLDHQYERQCTYIPNATPCTTIIGIGKDGYQR
jgi:hypothetical protein